MVTLELFKLLVPVLGKTVNHFDDMMAFVRKKSQGSIAMFVCSMQGGILDLSLTHVTDSGTLRMKHREELISFPVVLLLIVHFAEILSYEKHLEKSICILQSAHAKRSKETFLNHS
jgi:hypothetical protein